MDETAQNQTPPLQHPIIHEHRFQIPHILTRLSLLLFVCIGIIIGIVLTLVYKNFTAPKGTISASGVGTVYLLPTDATVKVDITTSDPDKITAETMNKQTTQNITNSVMTLGVPMTTISTASPIINPPRSAAELANETPDLAAIDRQYYVTSVMTIQFTKNTLSFADKVVDDMGNFNASVETNNSNSPTKNGVYYIFRAKSLAPYFAQARTLAINDSKAHAQKIAQLNNKTLGKAIDIKDTTYVQYEPTLANDGTVKNYVTQLGYDLSLPISAAYDITYEEY